MSSDPDTDSDPIDDLILQPAAKRARARQAREAAVVALDGIGDTSGGGGGSGTADASGAASSDLQGKKKGKKNKKNKKQRKRSGSSSSLAGLEGVKQQQSPGDGDGAQQQGPASLLPAAPQTHLAGGQQSDTVAPVGVLVIPDGTADLRSQERSKRVPRYFDEVYEPKGVACWRCGRRGHLAKDCVGRGMGRPCFYCAQYGHEPSVCPHRICFRCGRPGHMSKDCSSERGATSTQAGAAAAAACQRCGRASCPASAYSDWYRFEGGCTCDYASADLSMSRCVVCGARGHLCCRPSPLTPTSASCWNCGGAHWAEECHVAFPAHLMAERLQDRDRHRAGGTGGGAPPARARSSHEHHHHHHRDQQTLHEAWRRTARPPANDDWQRQHRGGGWVPPHGGREAERDWQRSGGSDGWRSRSESERLSKRARYGDSPGGWRR